MTYQTDTETDNRPHATAVVWPIQYGVTTRQNPGPTSRTEPDLPPGSPLYVLRYAYPYQFCGRQVHQHGHAGPLPEPGQSLGWRIVHCGTFHKPFRSDCQPTRERDMSRRMCWLKHADGLAYAGQVELFMPLTEEYRDAEHFAAVVAAYEKAYRSTRYALRRLLHRRPTVLEVLEDMTTTGEAAMTAEGDTPGQAAVLPGGTDRPVAVIEVRAEAIQL